MRAIPPTSKFWCQDVLKLWGEIQFHLYRREAPGLGRGQSGRRCRSRILGTRGQHFCCNTPSPEHHPMLSKEDELKVKVWNGTLLWYSILCHWHYLHFGKSLFTWKSILWWIIIRSKKVKLVATVKVLSVSSKHWMLVIFGWKVRVGLKVKLRALSELP